MSEKEPPKISQPLTDAQIITEKKLQRRSFLGSTGILLAGAAALATGLHAKAGGEPDDTPRSPDRPADQKRDDRDRTDRKRDDHDRDRRPDDRDKKHDQSRI